MTDQCTKSWKTQVKCTWSEELCFVPLTSALSSWGSLCCGFTAPRAVCLYVRTNVSHFLRNNQHRDNHSILLLLPLTLLIFPQSQTTHTQQIYLPPHVRGQRMAFFFLFFFFFLCSRLLFPKINPGSGSVQKRKIIPRSFFYDHTRTPSHDETAAEARSRVRRSFMSISRQQLRSGNITLKTHAHSVIITALITGLVENTASAVCCTMFYNKNRYRFNWLNMTH